MGYKIEDAAEDVRKRKEEWEKGKGLSEIQKKPVGDMGYKVDDAEDIKKRREDWEKGKAVPTGAKSPGDVGYKVEAEGVKDRLQKWASLNSKIPSATERKEPVKIPTVNTTKEDQMDVKTVKYEN